MKKNKSISLGRKRKNSLKRLWSCGLSSTLAISIILGFLLTLSLAIVVFISFGNGHASVNHLAANDGIDMPVTPLGVNMVLLIAIIISGIIILFSSKEKEKKKKGGV